MPRSRFIQLLPLVLLLFVGIKSEAADGSDAVKIACLQGEMVGETTTNSAILQSRFVDLFAHVPTSWEKRLPDPFHKPDGTRVASPEEWPEQRRDLKAMLNHYLYGSIPPRPKTFGLKRVMSRLPAETKARMLADIKSLVS